MDGFWSKRCLNYRIDVPDKIGSIQVVPPPPWWSKIELKNFFEGFLNVLNVLNMMGPEVPSRARRALPALRRSEKEDGCRPSEFLVYQI